MRTTFTFWQFMVLVSVWFIFIFHIRLNVVSCCFSGRVNLVCSPVDFWHRLHSIRVHDEIRDVFDCRCCFSVILQLPQCEMTSVCADLDFWDGLHCCGFRWSKIGNLEQQNEGLCKKILYTFYRAVDVNLWLCTLMNKALEFLKRNIENRFENISEALSTPMLLQIIETAMHEPVTASSQVERTRRFIDPSKITRSPQPDSMQWQIDFKSNFRSQCTPRRRVRALNGKFREENWNFTATRLHTRVATVKGSQPSLWFMNVCVVEKSTSLNSKKSVHEVMKTLRV